MFGAQKRLKTSDKNDYRMSSSTPLHRELEIGKQFAMEGAVGMEQVGFDRTGRTIKPSGDAFQRKVVVVAQGKHGALAGCHGVNAVAVA